MINIDLDNLNRERAKIARAGGYTVKFIEGVLSKRRIEDETEIE